ncbi:MAG: Smr/MutS family protein [Proteobacteria bacterium]|nr:Smr/MutS family protein [Pseudomonadota bacterium]
MPRPPDDDPVNDDAAFRAAVGDVKPLPPQASAPRAPRPRPRARFRRADERAVLEESLALGPGEWLVETGDELLFRRAHLSARLLERLRRGEFAVEDEIDLHGLTAVEARAALREFLTEALGRRLACVRVVHGKGLRSGPRGPVLKHAVNVWLRKVEAVLAFASAPGRDGGTGAVYVLLARR